MSRGCLALQLISYIKYLNLHDRWGFRASLLDPAITPYISGFFATQLFSPSKRRTVVTPVFQALCRLFCQQRLTLLFSFGIETLLL